MTRNFEGRCACGAVQFGFDEAPSFIANCHCKDCKKASGGAMATFFAVAETDFAVTSGEAKPFPYIAESGKALKRNFCPTCGARLFTSDLQSFPGLVFVMIGSLDEPERITPKLEMFTKRRLPWMIPFDLPQFPAMPH